MTKCLKNGYCANIYMNTIRKRCLISNSIRVPFIKPPCFQHPRTYFSQFPQRKLKEVSVSFVRTMSTTKPCFSWIPKTGFIGWYLGMINTRPILTKSITSGLVYTAADLSSQTMTRSSSEAYDAVRTCRMGGFGMMVLGPCLHYWFNLLSTIIPKRDLIATLKKMVMGKIIFGPAVTLVFLSLNAGVQGESGSEIVARLKRDLIPSVLNGVMYWAVCDFFVFKFTPLHLQPLVSNSFAYIWTIYMTYMASLEKAADTK